MGYEVLDFGTHSPDSVDYADFAHPLAEAIENGELERGIGPLRLGRRDDDDPQQASGIRAGLAWEPEIASLIRRHNNANIIVFPARFITNDEAWRCSTPISQPSSKADARTPHRKDGDPLRRSGDAAK